MTTDEAIRLLMNHLNVANQIEDRMNQKRLQWGINTTQMLVLAELTPRARGRGRAKSESRAASASELAANLSESRAMISIQLKALRDKGLVQQIESASLVDRRARRVYVTAAGARMASEVRELLTLLSTVLCISIGHKLAPTNAKAMALLVEKLPDAPELLDADSVIAFRRESIRAKRAVTMKRRGR